MWINVHKHTVEHKKNEEILVSFRLVLLLSLGVIEKVSISTIKKIITATKCEVPKGSKGILKSKKGDILNKLNFFVFFYCLPTNITSIVHIFPTNF